MSDMILNETPVRTSRNFNINNTKIDYEKIKKYLNIKTDFKNVKVINENKTILIDENVESVYNTYSISKELDDNINNYANNKKRIVIDKKSRSPIEFEFKFDNKNTLLINNINIIANENSEATVIFKYISDKDIECFHNKMLNVDIGDETLIVAEFLKQILTSGVELTVDLKEKSLIGYKDFLESIASKCNVDVFTLLTDSTYKDTVAEYLSKLYNGDVSDTGVDYSVEQINRFKPIVDEASKKYNIQIEELFSNPLYLI